MAAQALNQVIGLGGQTTGIERKNLDGQFVAHNDIGEHHVFGTEAVRHDGGGVVRGDCF